ncbi:MAG: hypothetical protein ABI743_09795 [bacterium]
MNPSWRLAPLITACLWLLLVAPLQAAGGGTPPVPAGENAFALQFIKDYQSYNVATFGPWIHPRHGLIDQRELKTREQVLADFSKTGAALKNFKVTYTFGHGEFQGDQFYKALFLQSGGTLPKVNVRLNFICEFEKIGDRWYLVQSHNYTATSESWLMVGDVIDDASLVGTTLGDRRFSINYAVGRSKPVLLSFCDQGKDVFLNDNAQHLKTVHQWYSELRTQPIYVMNVNESSAQTVKEYLTLNKLMMPCVTDVDSLWHKSLQVDVHPFLLLLDQGGVIRAMNRPGEGRYNADAYGLFRQIVSDVIAETPGGKSGQNSATKAIDPSSKF